ncbi:S8 family serine peptidase [candidate division KSB1 bacterium]|nr:S8 family serine peptidase [candidate division KSB1 bacterium]
MVRNIVAGSIAILLFLTSLFPAAAATQKADPAPVFEPRDQSMVQNTDNTVKIVPGQIIVKFKSDFTKGTLRKANNNVVTGVPSIDSKIIKWNINKVDKIFPEEKAPIDPVIPDLSRIFKLRFPVLQDVHEVAEEFAADPAVEYAEPVYAYQIDVMPNDPRTGDQKHLDIIKIAQAWEKSKGDKNVVIGIIDTGVDWQHEDLAANIRVNPGEDINHDGVITAADENNIDDDGNGYIDDFRGWDFVATETASGLPDPSNDEDGTVPDNDPMDVQGHGTHCAGIASAVTDNGVGIAGTGWNCSIMPIRAGYKYIDDQGFSNGTIPWGYEGVKYAADNGADIISLSWGGSASFFGRDAIDYAYYKGVLIIAAAGNSNNGSGNYSAHYPSAYDHVVSVAATRYWIDRKAGFSLYHESVDICAPGDAIYSTYPNNSYAEMGGTSMSTPMVAGVAGLVKALHPEWSNDRVALQIIETADNIDDDNSDYFGWLGSGRINAYRALTEAPIHLVNYIVDDAENSNHNGVIDWGETAQIVVSLQGIAEDFNNVTLKLLTTDPYVNINNSIVNLGALLNGQIVNNAGEPFLISTNPDAPIGHQVNLKLVIESNNGAYTNVKFVKFFIQPIFMDHDINNAKFTITSIGAVGFSEYVDTGAEFGSGFKYSNNYFSSLYHGSLWVGTDPSHVSDCAYGNDTFDNFDWITSEGGFLRMDKTDVSDQDGFAVFNDSRSENPIGLEVTQNSYAWASAPDDDYVVMEYLVKNTSGQTLNNVYVGLYMDWDIVGNDDAYNFVDYDESNKLGYMSAPGANYFGIAMLYPEPSSYRALDHELYVYGNALNDASKYTYMSEGFNVTASDRLFDWSHVLSTGPLSIPAGGEETVTFAVLGGDDLADLQFNAQTASDKYSALAPAGIQIVHTPLKDTENTTDPYKVEAEIVNQLSNVNGDSVFVYWQVGEEEKLSRAKMTATGNNIFTGYIPAQSETDVHYYITANDDKDRVAYTPLKAPTTKYTFHVGTDTVKPEIENVTQLPNTFNTTGPYIITAKVTDNLGVDIENVKLNYSVNDSETKSVTMIRQGSTDNFGIELEINQTLTSGDVIHYQVSAQDMAASPNVRLSAMYQFSIVRVLLVDDFEGTINKWDMGSGWGPNFYAHSGGNAMTDSPAGYYEPNADNRLTLLETYNISGKSSAYVSYYYLHFFGLGDSVYFEVSGDGSTWEKCRAYGGNQFEYLKDVVSLEQFTGDKGKSVRFRFRLVSNDDLDISDGFYVDDIYIYADTVVTAIDKGDKNTLPRKFALLQNYPNPFNPQTTISYELPKDGRVTVDVFSILGEHITTLVDREHKAGRYSIIWNGLNSKGSQVSSGVYFYKINSGSFTDVKKMILLK